MASIKQHLDTIMSRIFGEEIRGAIRDAIDAINKESEQAKTDASEGKDSAKTSAEQALLSATNANEAYDKLYELYQNSLKLAALFQTWTQEFNLEDEDGNPVTDADGNPITGSVDLIIRGGDHTFQKQIETLLDLGLFESSSGIASDADKFLIMQNGETKTITLKDALFKGRTIINDTPKPGCEGLVPKPGATTVPEILSSCGTWSPLTINSRREDSGVRVTLCLGDIPIDSMIMETRKEVMSYSSTIELPTVVSDDPMNPTSMDYVVISKINEKIYNYFTNRSRIVAYEIIVGVEAIDNNNSALTAIDFGCDLKFRLTCVDSDGISEDVDSVPTLGTVKVSYNQKINHNWVQGVYYMPLYTSEQPTTNLSVFANGFTGNYSDRSIRFNCSVRPIFYDGGI